MTTVCPYPATSSKRYHCEHDGQLQRTFGPGLTCDAFWSQWDRQTGGCGACGKRIAARGESPKLAIDHNHVSGLWRGLLCRSCNRLLTEAVEKEIERTGADGPIEAVDHEGRPIIISREAVRYVKHPPAADLNILVPEDKLRILEARSQRETSRLEFKRQHRLNRPTPQPPADEPDFDVDPDDRWSDRAQEGHRPRAIERPRPEPKPRPAPHPAPTPRKTAAQRRREERDRLREECANSHLGRKLRGACDCDECRGRRVFAASWTGGGDPVWSGESWREEQERRKAEQRTAVARENRRYWTTVAVTAVVTLSLAGGVALVFWEVILRGLLGLTVIAASALLAAGGRSVGG